VGGNDRVLKDVNMPDGDACRPDGTLKEASEMVFPNSPSEALLELPVSKDTPEDDYFFLNLKRNLPSDDSNESNQEGEDSDANDDTTESVASPRSKGQRKVPVSHYPTNYYTMLTVDNL
jgi:hypothetical protein